MPKFLATRVQRHFTMHLAAPKSEVFVLLCPVREHDWIDGWKGQLVYSKSGLAEDDCVFTVDMGAQGLEICATTRYEPEHSIVEFVFVLPGSHVDKLELAVVETGASSCRVEWTRTYTGLSDQGNAFLADFTGEPITQRMQFLEKALNHYLTTGQKLKQTQ